jgi:hypothetical protein
MVRMYYYRKELASGRGKTPNPFLEMRVYVYTRNPKIYSDDFFNAGFESLRRFFHTIVKAEEKEKVSPSIVSWWSNIKDIREIVGYEVEKIDADEINAEFRKYQKGNVFPPDTMLRYVAKYNEFYEIEYEYDELFIRTTLREQEIRLRIREKEAEVEKYLMKAMEYTEKWRKSVDELLELKKRLEEVT